MRDFEHQIQKAVIEWCNYQSQNYPELRLLYAIPNGGHRHYGVAKKLKAEGVKPGVPDLHLPVARDIYHGLYIEMKTPKGAIRPSQKDWINALIEQGYLVVVCRSVDDAILILQAYLEKHPELLSIASSLCPQDLLIEAQ